MVVQSPHNKKVSEPIQTTPVSSQSEGTGAPVYWCHVHQYSSHPDTGDKVEEPVQERIFNGDVNITSSHMLLSVANCLS